ncbi:IclR family transcriptional regulator [Lysinibacillus sp. SGAir0095]|uniref:IclR family transcriptional regulator n=1 Tax=Lysinibacillus sp. SGAir0095 TaxID=2070463 RepID=UPI0010CD1075|nr:helix-turn-helix domain-containing protein [Lysinibacillus sp. SGAir0095]QCR31336.1 IclR family transcriptional regulator [Lysinibacillus sp. SGAir0095]
MTTKNKVSVIQSLQVGLNILDVLAEHKEPLKFTDIQNSTSMTKSNLYKYLSTLCEFGVVHRNPVTNTYSLGQKLIQLGNVALGQSSIIELVIPYLKKINDNTKLTALLAIPSVNGPLITYISSADYGINIGAQIGTTLPLSSSTGIIYSAFLNSQVKEWVENEVSNLNNDELQMYETEKENAKKSFFATKIEPLVEHVSSFSVPILNFNKELIGAITVVGYTEIVPKTADHSIGQLVLDISRQVSEYYGYPN